MLLEDGDIMAKPPRHGQIKVATMKPEHMKQHLAQMTASASEVADYHRGGEVTGQFSGGAMSPGGASSANYQTSSADSVGDADSQGSTGY
jgi:hypothetical protein